MSGRSATDRAFTALVTGANGFLGRYVSRTLSAGGFRVTGIGHGTWASDEWRAWGIDEWHQCDVTLETMGSYGGEPQIIAHCAGSGSVAYSVKYPLQDYRRTVDTTTAVLEHMRVTSSKAQLVVPSSAAVYGAVKKMPIGVDVPLRPVSPYGVHKKIVEDLCRSYGRHFGVRTSIVRLFSVYGVGLRKQLLWDACNKIRTGDFSFMGSGRETRDLIYVEDAADLMLAAARKASSDCLILNGGSGEAVRTGDIIKAVMAAFDAKGTPSFSGAPSQGDPAHYQADITEALALGWSPRFKHLSQIDAYVSWFKAERE